MPRTRPSTTAPPRVSRSSSTQPNARPRSRHARRSWRRDKTSLEKSLKALRYFKAAVEIGELAASDKPGSSFGVLKGAVTGVEAYYKDPISQANKLYQAKMFETEKARRAFNSTIARGTSRGDLTNPRGYFVPRILGQKKGVDAAEGKEFEAEGMFKHNAQITGAWPIPRKC